MNDLRSDIIEYLTQRKDVWVDVISLTSLTTDYDMLTKILKQLEKEKVISVILCNKRNKLIRIL